MDFSTRIITFSRPIVTADWDRVLRYSHRVKEFVCPSSWKEDLSQVYDVLLETTIPGQYLLPNLQSFADTGTLSSTHLGLFISPRIVEIKWSSNHISSLPILTQRQRDLRVVVLDQDLVYVGTQANPHISAFLRGLTHLSTLETGYMDEAALTYLGGLTSLRELTLRTLPSLPSSLCRQGLFAHLTQMTIFTHHSTPESMPAFIRTWTTPPLVSFSLMLATESPDEGFTEDLFSALSEHCTPDTLQFLEVVQWGNQYEHITHGTTLTKLARFVNLTHVSIMTSGGYNLDDAELGTLARAWPNIEVLELKAIWHGHRPRVTLGSLRMLAEWCPYIHQLELTIDASVIPPPIEFHSRRQLIQQYLTTLGVGYSPISSAFDVALYISGIYCNLRRIHGEKDDWDLEEEAEVDERDRREKEWSDRWKEVERMLPGLDEVRSEEFNWGRDSIQLADYMSFEWQV
ncbi:hypothetical protein FB45DRAFT_1030585 [Roridomyces roridus]|uniref:F-box domain protein n=1 Tax=Roridomyces roridus TaxID=1738132 RepID=A0AAD7FHB1_9AGAR|nr:hypothetical protein FB45DRAFT_1030585 [Roridomyces roridus]